ncbi:hypothetical protein HFO07_26755 [Rhizobium leguminosarum]|uniref:hypothetical protein n=1 Tax=Rhizobium leguminosarum TaxID=384 RepID=UPI001C9443D7|nr:hypothetical protein [Rhizobium leguminosarum]MBY5760215.1 hypothetical protein [Rhizobium leguminosarum]
MSSPCPSPNLLILACSAIKRTGPHAKPAIPRHDGPLWRTLRTVDPGGEKARVGEINEPIGPVRCLLRRWLDSRIGERV